MKKSIFLVIILPLSTKFLFCQNLIPNGSFENHTSCPTKISQLDKAFPWHSPTMGTPDYFHECNDTITGEVSVPDNFIGYQFARTGVAFANVLLYYEYAVRREYISAPLMDTLKAGKSYYAEMFLSLADVSKWAVDGIGMYFSNGAPDTTGIEWGVIPYIPQISNVSGNLLLDTLNWMKVSGKFTSVGNENYITIGNFKNDSSIQKFDVGSTISSHSHYYIDDILLIEDTIVGIHNLNFTNYDFKIFPNPFSENATVEMYPKTANPKPATFIIYDHLGKKVKEISVMRSKKFELNRDGMSNGIYFYSVFDKEYFVIARGKLAIQ